MSTYTIDTRSNEMGLFTVEAASHHEAASLAAAKIWPKYRTIITVNRETGDPHGSGMFQAYIPLGQQRSSHGNMFHVSEN
ncbi:hypothetical protein [[Pseudomonas] boreopolis]|uniref:Uncharacterized protein n=1 Tax=Xanthomonas boreopolis TaxID=86183 RepID=A0A919FD55_9XANT|nr:hypothetical protein GCM10009090_37370 [[Pseudomonas] boreopolis]